MKNQELGTATRVIILAMVISVLSLFVLVGVLVLIHICVVLREFNRRTDSINMAERGSTSMSMSKEDIEKLPCFVFQAKEKGTSTPVDCVICLDNFKMGDKCRMLPQCNHSFHAECIDLWLLKSLYCPICRTSTDILGGCSISAGESSGCSGSGQTRQELS
ncbi:hypothetical protein R3W88_007072 [Solanum pinnatisectum]|uniref:RING-type domain-containing protein n=1 Tax=Solanum pinnatisectum TaxID=50273 RepID=A0AAV9KH12_9SOLN|nr:hypothetical protein R3W88_007072 [Solanum pinnatisectum]